LSQPCPLTYQPKVTDSMNYSIRKTDKRKGVLKKEKQ
jgi:hypothetical protein